MEPIRTSLKRMRSLLDKRDECYGGLLELYVRSIIFNDCAGIEFVRNDMNFVTMMWELEISMFTSVIDLKFGSERTWTDVVKSRATARFMNILYDNELALTIPLRQARSKSSKIRIGDLTGGCGYVDPEVIHLGDAGKISLLAWSDKERSGINEKCLRTNWKNWALMFSRTYKMIFENLLEIFSVFKFDDYTVREFLEEESNMCQVEDVVSSFIDSRMRIDDFHEMVQHSCFEFVNDCSSDLRMARCVLPELRFNSNWRWIDLVIHLCMVKRKEMS